MLIIWNIKDDFDRLKKTDQFMKAFVSNVLFHFNEGSIKSSFVKKLSLNQAIDLGPLSMIWWRSFF